MENDCEYAVGVLKIAREMIEALLNKTNPNLADMSYCKGIRDACWAIDDLIKELKTEEK